MLDRGPDSPTLVALLIEKQLNLVQLSRPPWPQISRLKMLKLAVLMCRTVEGALQASETSTRATRPLTSTPGENGRVSETDSKLGFFQ